MVNKSWDSTTRIFWHPLKPLLKRLKNELYMLFDEEFKLKLLYFTTAVLGQYE
jgi:hypothetical protein